MTKARIEVGGMTASVSPPPPPPCCDQPRSLAVLATLWMGLLQEAALLLLLFQVSHFLVGRGGRGRGL